MPNEKHELDAAAVDAQADTQEQDLTPANDGDGVDTLVSALRSHMQVAEDRHADVLTDMRERLGALGGDVTEIRDRIPTDLSGTLAGIETGIESLHERVAQIAIPGGAFDSTSETAMDVSNDETHAASAEPADETDHVNESVPQDVENDVDISADAEQYDAPSIDEVPASDDVSPAHISEPDAMDSGHLENDDSADMAPVALKSAAENWEQPAQSEPSKLAEVQGVDTFDMVETSMPGDPNSPWDEESAAALTNLYDEPVTGGQDVTSDKLMSMPTRTPDPEAEVSSEFAQDQTHSDAPGDRLEVDRDWLDAKFSEIAERIEQTLSELDPEKTTAHLGEQIQTIESRFENALQDVATRSDLEGLKDLESHVTGMASQLAQTETHMQRLDTIEGTLHEVVQRFTEGAGSPFVAGEGAVSGGVDAEHVAEVAAARIADHLAASGQSGDPAALSDVRSLFDDFLTQQRQDTAQTAATLDTIQDAMVQILDRLDVLENGGSVERAAPAIAEQYGEPIDVAAAEGWSNPGEGHGSDDDIALTDPVQLAGSAAPEAYAGEQEADVEIHVRSEDATPTEVARGPQPEPVGVDAGAEAAPSSQAQQVQDLPPGTASPDLLSDRLDAVVVPTEAGGQSRDTIDKIRHNFIADAQQAKAKAAQAALQEPEAPKKSARASVLAGMRSSGDADAPAAGFFASKTKRLLIGALLAVIVIQGALFLIPRGEEAAPEAPAAPAAVTAPTESKEGAASDNQKLEKSSSLVANDGFAPAVSDEVVLEDLRAAITDAHGRAGGSLDLPFGLVLQQTTAKQWTKQGRPIYGGEEAEVTPIAATANAQLPVVNRGRTQDSVATQGASERVAMPPLTVGPTSLRMAAANGDPSAQFEVATRLAEGKGTKQNFNEAAKWFKRSAGQGFAQAQYRLGTLYERGLGVGRDTNRAQMWYLRAAEQGNIRSMHNLAVLNAGQASGTPDYTRASRWFLKAAESGLADSQFNVGVLYENGLGVSKDLVQAYKWYTLAARTGDQESLKRSQKIRAELEIDVLGEAETAVRSFKPAPVKPLINNARLAGQEWKSRQNG